MREPFLALHPSPALSEAVVGVAGPVLLAAVVGGLVAACLTPLSSRSGGIPLASALLSIAAAASWACIVVCAGLVPRQAVALLVAVTPGLYAAALLLLLDSRAAAGMLAYAAAAGAAAVLAPHWVRVMAVSTLHIVAGMVILITPFMASYSAHLKASSAGAVLAGAGGVMMMAKILGAAPKTMTGLLSAAAGYCFAFAALLLPVGLLLASREEAGEAASTPVESAGGEAGGVEGVA